MLACLSGCNRSNPENAAAKPANPEDASLPAFLRDLPQDSTKFVILKHLSFVHLWIDALKGQLHLRDMIIQASIAVFWTFQTAAPENLFVPDRVVIWI